MVKKKAIINPKNNDDKCFQYAITAALNYEQVNKTDKKYVILNPVSIYLDGDIFPNT